MFLCLFENLHNEKFLFLKDKMNGQSPAIFCFVLQLFFFLKSSASSMTWKVLLLLRLPNVLVPVRLSTYCDESTPAPLCYPYPISLLETDRVASHQTNSSSLLSQLCHCYYLLPLFWQKPQHRLCLFPSLHPLGQTANASLQHNSNHFPLHSDCPILSKASTPHIRIVVTAF